MNAAAKFLEWCGVDSSGSAEVVRRANVKYPEVKTMLEKLGMDPSLVLEDGITEHAYRMTVLDRNDAQVLRGNQLRVRGRSWPTPRVGRIVVALMKLRDSGMAA